jgi:hypothetical protein
MVLLIGSWIVFRIVHWPSCSDRNGLNYHDGAKLKILMSVNVNSFPLMVVSVMYHTFQELYQFLYIKY